MTIGNAGAIDISPEMMRGVLAAIEEYRNIAISLHAKLTETVDSLIPNNFNGSAAVAYHQFYADKVEKVIEATGEIGTLAQMLNALENICMTVQYIFTAERGIDENLAEYNNNR